MMKRKQNCTSKEEKPLKKNKVEDAHFVSGNKKLFELIAGLSFEQAVNNVKELYETTKVRGLLNIGGEHYHDAKYAIQDCEKYISLLKLVCEKNASNCISVSIKPTQIGLGIQKELFLKNLSLIADEADKCGVHVEVDMEQFHTLEETVDVFISVVKKHPKLLMRLAVPSEFKCSIKVVERIVKEGGGIRMIRGKCYSDVPKDEIYEDDRDIIKNYLEMVKRVPSDKIAFATGNTDLLKKCYELFPTVDKTKIEHQYLLGLPYHKKIYENLSKTGTLISLYQPVGSWSKVRAYVLRRNFLNKEEIDSLDKKYLKQ